MNDRFTFTGGLVFGLKALRCSSLVSNAAIWSPRAFGAMALVRLGADVVGGLLIDQGLIEEGHHLAHQIEIGALVDSIRERGQVKLLMGHRSISLSCLLQGHAENAPMARLLGGPSK